MKYLLLLFLILAPSIFVPAQTLTDEGFCKQPASSKFDEFEYTNLDDAKERMDLYGLQIKNHNSYAVIIVYGGKKSEANEARSIGSKLEDYLTETFNFPKYSTVSAINGGHREKAMVELFIKPASCSEKPVPTPTLSYDDVIFKEESSFFSDKIIRKTTAELNDLLVEGSEPKLPPAARAVRASGKVLLLIVVDENGSVVKVSVLDGHPLLRAASETAVRARKYEALKVNKKSVKFGGKVVIDWNKIWDSQKVVEID